VSYPAQPFKDKEFARKFYELMVRSRVLEEKLIRMAKSDDGFFWIGGPGEEAFNISLGLQVKKGHGLEHDFLHLHYRNNGTLLAMGSPMIDFIRQMKNSKNDPFSGGRNFVSHVCKKEWNVVPATSTIETQYSVSPGTARAQWRARQQGKDAGVTIVVGGDAGSAEGDFATCLIWASRPEQELPMLIIVTNNSYGISTSAETQHGEKNVSDRGKAFGIETLVCDGNNPERIWSSIEKGLDYVRGSGRPFILEAKVSRLNGHSSSSGANRVDEPDCIEIFERKLLKNAWITEEEISDIRKSAQAEVNKAHEEVRKEPYPDAGTFQDHTYADGKRGGIPGRDF